MDFLFVFPENPNSFELSLASNISSYLGHDSKYSNNINVLTSNDMKKYDGKQNAIIISSIENSKELIKNLNEKLNLRYNENISDIQPDEKVPLIKERKYLKTIQMIDLDNKANKGLVVSAMENRALNWASKYLSDLNLEYKLKGYTVVIDKDGIIENVYFRPQPIKEKEKELEHEEELKKQKGINKAVDIVNRLFGMDKKNFIIFLLVIMTIIILSIIFIAKRE